MALNLNGPQQRQLMNALLDAFPDYDALQQMVRFGLNENLDSIVSRGNLTTVAFELIKWAMAKGRLEELLVATIAENPQNLKLCDVVNQLQTPNAHMIVEQPELEKIIQKSVKFTDIDTWLENLRLCSQAVCRVEVSTNDSIDVSTGFLIGPNVVITNYHTVEAVIANPAISSNVTFRFDYKVDEYGNDTHMGIERFLVSDTNWFIASSPIQELDYALLYITTEDTKGRETFKRIYLQPKRHTFVSGEPLIIIQHPQGSPMKISTGSVTAIDTNQTRVHYTTNTLGGSSGSPCFDSEIVLVALHQGANSSANHGVPFFAILTHLQSEGLLNVLGEQNL